MDRLSSLDFSRKFVLPFIAVATKIPRICGQNLRIVVDVRPELRVYQKETHTIPWLTL